MTARQRKTRARRRKDHASIGTGRRLAIAGGLTAGATLAIAGAAQAAPQTYTVGTNADSSSGGACTTPTNNDCSLREAITLSNSNAGADTIVFNSNLSGNVITLASALPTVGEALTVQGPGAAQLTVNGNDDFRILSLDPSTGGAPIGISGLTLSNGDPASGDGGAINNKDSNLTISDSVIRDSDAPKGGGLYTAAGEVQVVRSTITGNNALTGGGIYTAQSNVLIQKSTLDHNVAGGGGAITTTIFSGAALTINNSTIAYNQATDSGAINRCCAASPDLLTIRSSTITQNSGANIGGVNFATTLATATVENSIISGNIGAPGKKDVYSGPGGIEASFSLIGDPGPYVTTTVPGSNLFGVDPQLGPLQANGGPTATILPAATSPVIDCGADATYDFDQRASGFPRVVDQPNRAGSTAPGANQADIGAVELAADGLITGTCMNPPPTPATGVAGQRAAALARCKKRIKAAVRRKRAQGALTAQVKKKLKKQLRTCKRRAGQLPV